MTTRPIRDNLPNREDLPLIASFRTSLATLALAAAVIAGFSPARAQEAPPEAPKLADDIHETIGKVPVTVKLLSGQSYSGAMVVTHFRPDGAGPFPIVIFNHGRATSKEKRATPPRMRYTAVARYWVRRGFAVFVPTRLGYGDSGLDPDPENAGGGCDSRDFAQPIAVIIKSTEAVLAFAKSQPWTDGKRVIVMGQSYGGMGAVGISGESWPGLIAAINFAGGGGGDPDAHPEKPCSPTRLAELYNAVGKHASVPMLWLYAQNDKYWGADWPRKWHAAYVGGGGRAEFAPFPPVGDNGHRLIDQGFALWRPVLDRFIAKFGIAPPKARNAPPATDFARLDDATKLPFVKPDVKTDGYMKFLNADVPRALAIGKNGAWSWRRGVDSPQQALDDCATRANEPCQLYAVDDAVVWKP